MDIKTIISIFVININNNIKEENNQAIYKSVESMILRIYVYAILNKYKQVQLLVGYDLKKDRIERLKLFIEIKSSKNSMFNSSMQ